MTRDALAGPVRAAPAGFAAAPLDGAAQAAIYAAEQGNPMLSSMIPLGVMLSGGSPIDLDGSFFIQLGIFFIAFLILRALVFRPVMNLFDARAAAMEGSRDRAAEMEQGAEQKREQLESQLRSVRQKASEERDKTRLAAQQLARELTDKARRENTAMLSSAKAQLDAEAKDARTALRSDVTGLARQIAEKLLGRSVH
jgi:F-type H+-transporting ATPase subunit b